jgi:hypothetical protein
VGEDATQPEQKTFAANLEQPESLKKELHKVYFT